MAQRREVGEVMIYHLPPFNGGQWLDQTTKHKPVLQSLETSN